MGSSEKRPDGEKVNQYENSFVKGIKKNLAFESYASRI